MNRRGEHAKPEPTVRSRMEGVFLAAVVLAPADQSEFLEGECAGDPELRAGVERLLRSDGKSRSESQWAGPAWNLTALRFGPYRAVGRIASGGMGTVYEAFRDDAEFHKRVAIKTIPPSLLTGFGAEGLRRERQILAQLEHPHIARLLDGGTTEDGVPYLVMEYVEGCDLLEFAREHVLNTKRRLELFVGVCDAVAYAHGNLVIHRDLKPSNILVTADGTPKLLDFGIARLLDSAAERTQTLARALTPEYASPEQILGQRLTTAVDVYSLGVLLYELITGERPYRVTGSTPMDLADAICRHDVPPPSRRIPERLRAARDLDAIVFTALHKDPQQRYASAREFANDIRLYLDDVPVGARRDTLAGRGLRFALRHRWQMYTAALVAPLLFAAAGYSLLASGREQRHISQIRELTQAYLGDVYDEVSKIPGSLKVRQAMVGRARANLDALYSESPGNKGRRAELAAAYIKLGDLQGKPYTANLGDTAGALNSYRRAESLLANSARSSSETQLSLVRARQGEGRILMRTGDIRQARAALSIALQTAQAVFASQPDRIDSRRALADSYLYLGQSIYLDGATIAGYEDARKQFNSALALVEDRPEIELRAAAGHYRTHVAYAIWYLAAMPGGPVGFRDALPLFIQSLDDADLVLKVRNDGEARLAHAYALQDLAEGYFKCRQYADGKQYQNQAREELLRISRDDPADMEVRRAIARLFVESADSYESMGRYADAKTDLLAGRTILEQLQVDDPESQENRAMLHRANLKISRLP